MEHAKADACDDMYEMKDVGGHLLNVGLGPRLRTQMIFEQFSQTLYGLRPN